MAWPPLIVHWLISWVSSVRPSYSRVQSIPPAPRASFRSATVSYEDRPLVSTDPPDVSPEPESAVAAVVVLLDPESSPHAASVRVAIATVATNAFTRGILAGRGAEGQTVRVGARGDRRRGAGH